MSRSTDRTTKKLNDALKRRGLYIENSYKGSAKGSQKTKAMRVAIACRQEQREDSVN